MKSGALQTRNWYYHICHSTFTAFAMHIYRKFYSCTCFCAFWRIM